MKTEVYCSFCSLPRRVYRKNHIGAPELAGFSFISIFSSYMIWQEFHWVGCMIFVILATVTETAYRLRRRQSLKCGSCGFDPVIYKSSPEKAAQLVNEFMAIRRDNPSFLLNRRPLIRPIIKKVDGTSKAYGQKDFDAPN